MGLTLAGWWCWGAGCWLGCWLAGCRGSGCWFAGCRRVGLLIDRLPRVGLLVDRLPRVRLRQGRLGGRRMLDDVRGRPGLRGPRQGCGGCPGEAWCTALIGGAGWGRSCRRPGGVGTRTWASGLPGVPGRLSRRPDRRRGLGVLAGDRPSRTLRRDRLGRQHQPAAARHEPAMQVGTGIGQDLPRFGQRQRDPVDRVGDTPVQPGQVLRAGQLDTAEGGVDHRPDRAVQQDQIPVGESDRRAPDRGRRPIRDQQFGGLPGQRFGGGRIGAVDSRQSIQPRCGERLVRARVGGEHADRRAEADHHARAGHDPDPRLRCDHCHLPTVRPPTPRRVGSTSSGMRSADPVPSVHRHRRRMSRGP